MDNPDHVILMSSIAGVEEASSWDEKEIWATEMQKHKMGPAAIGRMQELKDHDRDWQGRCSAQIFCVMCH